MTPKGAGNKKTKREELKSCITSQTVGRPRGKRRKCPSVKWGGGTKQDLKTKSETIKETKSTRKNTGRETKEAATWG